MANPVPVTINKGVWTLVAENTIYGLIDIAENRVDQFVKDHRIAGDPAPTDPNLTERQVNYQVIEIDSTDSIDVYLKYTGEKATVNVIVSI